MLAMLYTGERRLLLFGIIFIILRYANLLGYNQISRKSAVKENGERRVSIASFASECNSYLILLNEAFPGNQPNHISSRAYNRQRDSSARSYSSRNGKIYNSSTLIH